jgi:uncharacterized protein (TIGR03000 family)
MRANNAMTRNLWRRKVAAGVLIVLGFAAIGLPNSPAQMTYSGGFVQHHRRPPPDSLKATTPSPSQTLLPPSYFPDNDFYYPGQETGPSVSPPAAGAPYGVSAAVLPWNQKGFQEYVPSPASPEPSPSASRKYAMAVTPLPLESPAAKAETAMLIVHLPEPAMLWVEGRLIPLRGPTGYFQSPPLNPAKRYVYTVRAVWRENGRWVTLSREVPVAAGLVQALYLRPAPAL